MHEGHPQVVVFSSLNAAHVHLVRAHLENDGFKTSIRGEHRVGLAGELPMDDARIELLVSKREAPKALESIDALRQESSESWQCATCDVQNPGTFEICWQCQRVAYP